MRRILLLAAIFACASGAGARRALRVSSTSFVAGGDIPSKHTCDGGDVSPALSFTGIPADAKSVAIVVDDPDAPGGTFTHWIVTDIHPATTKVAEGAAPAGAKEGRNDFDTTGYKGPCPPSGKHRYVFRVLALDTTLRLDKPGRRALDRAVKGHIVAEGRIVGTYARAR